MIRTRTAPMEKARVSAQLPIVIVSERGPLSFSVVDGEVHQQPATGGLASALGAVAAKYPATWIAVAMSADDRRAAQMSDKYEFGTTDVQLVDVPLPIHQQHYATFANPFLWFVQHGMMGQLSQPYSQEAIDRAWTCGYLPANELVAHQAMLRVRRPDPIVLVQDYHFYLVPQLIRKVRPKARIAHFVHIPWPTPDKWEALPRSIVMQLLDGLLGADVVGFQSAMDAENFRAACKTFLPDTVVDESGSVRGVDGGYTRVRHYPITIDEPSLAGLLATDEAARYRVEQARDGKVGMQTILRIDRLDPSKNIPAGFKAYGRLLENAPELRGHVRFLAHLVPSRTELVEYQEEQRKVLAAVREVNDRYGTVDWQPIELIYEENRLRALVELENYDVLLVNSLADGMNLVAKEGATLNRRDGQIVLSNRAGSWEELKGWAFSIDPTDIPGTARALHQALVLPAEGRTALAAGLRCAVRATSMDRWLNDQINDLTECESKQPLARVSGDWYPSPASKVKSTSARTAASSSF